MKAFGVFLTLCTTLTLSPAVPLNSTALQGFCHYQRQNCSYVIGTLCLSCDNNGNFLVQQCVTSRPHRGCWCVDFLTGQTIPNTRTTLAQQPRCEYKRYCPDGWFWFGERCYTFISTPKKWIEAEIYCQFDGSNLASVHSEEENRFVTYLARGEGHFLQSWLGGFDAIQPGHWIWSDGSKFNYKNWYNQSYANLKNDSYRYNDDDSRHHDSRHDDDDDHRSRHHKHDSHHDDDDNSRHHDSHHDDDDDDSRHHDSHHDDDDDDSRHHDSHHDDDDDHRSRHHKHDSHHDSHWDNDDADHNYDSHHDDDDDHEDENRNCLRMNYEYDLKWFYTSCTESLPFVCSKKADAPM